MQGGPKKVPYFVFHPKVVFYNYFPYFSGGVDSRPGRFFWHQYGSNWTIYYAAVDKNHRGVLCHKISSSDTAAMQERFWQEQCTWYKDNSTFGGEILGDRKCSRCPTKASVVNIVQIIQMQQARVIFNPLIDILKKCFSFCFILVSLPLEDLNFVRKELMKGKSFCNFEFCKERAHHGGSSKLMILKCQFLLKDGILIFWENPHGVPVNSEYSQ